MADPGAALSLRSDRLSRSIASKGPSEAVSGIAPTALGRGRLCAHVYVRAQSLFYGPGSSSPPPSVNRRAVRRPGRGLLFPRVGHDRIRLNWPAIMAIPGDPGRDPPAGVADGLEQRLRVVIRRRFNHPEIRAAVNRLVRSVGAVGARAALWSTAARLRKRHAWGFRKDPSPPQNPAPSTIPPLSFRRPCVPPRRFP